MYHKTSHKLPLFSVLVTSPACTTVGSFLKERLFHVKIFNDVEDFRFLTSSPLVWDSPICPR